MTFQSKAAYLAGLLDTVGVFEADNGRLVVAFVAPKAVVKWAVQHFGGHRIGQDRWEWVHRWVQPSKRTEAILLAVLPYMIARRSHASEALQIVRNSLLTNPATGFTIDQHDEQNRPAQRPVDQRHGEDSARPLGSGTQTDC